MSDNKTSIKFRDLLFGLFLLCIYLIISFPKLSSWLGVAFVLIFLLWINLE